MTGGYVYHGTRLAERSLNRYVFGDFCNGRISRSARASAPAAKSLLIDTSLNISSFGEDEAGEIYVVDINGAVYRISAT